MTDLMDDISLLRKVTLAGNAQRRPDQTTQRDARFFWVLSASAPYFGRLNVFDKFDHLSGVNADHVYPLRVLTADQPRMGKAGGPAWRRPRLIDLHLLVGATNPFYAERDYQNEGDRDRLIISFSKTSSIEVPAQSGSILQTFPEAEEPTAASEEVSRKAPFVRCVAEPLPLDDNQWPPPSDTSEIIPVPPLRLIAGRVALRVALVDTGGRATENLRWLKQLGIDSEKQGNADWAKIWLTPDGIEFDAVFKAFPGSSESRLYGRVRLAADERGRFYLNFLSAVKGTENAWRAAWSAITPSARDNREDDLLGLKFAASHASDIPAFRWPVTMQNGRPVGLGSLEIPQRALRIELVSPAENGDIDGVASLATGWVKAAEVADKVTFTFGEPLSQPAKVKIACLPESIELTTQGKLQLGIHVDRLATDLREAYGIQTPAVENGQPAGPQLARPLIPAFVPMVDGWLQLPVPNLGPRDPDQDIDLATIPPAKQERTLFGDGFFRLKSLGPPPGVLSAGGGDLKLRTQAPWVVTIAKATRLYGTVDVSPRQDNAGGSAAGLLERARIEVDGFDFSARGLVWVSADRPDAFEALPRFGAGPSSFVDLSFENGDADLLRVWLSDLTITATRSNRQAPPDPMIVERADIAIEFNTKGKRWIGEILKPQEARRALTAAVKVVDGKTAANKMAPQFAAGAVSPWSPVVWQRHRTIPLAATMPMTRAAAGAVRPLESRDLMPFVLETDVNTGWQQLATLRVATGDPFVTLLDNGLHYKPVDAWPWDSGNDINKIPDRGIAFAALGLPGVELRPVSVASLHADIPYEASLRFDLPLLDEAFAIAPLPPQPGGPASKEERESPPPKPVATALDWPLFAEFWGDQERKHQNSRVADSYMMPFKPVDRSAADSKVDVKTLIKGLTWGDVSIQIGTKPVAGKLSYGSLSIDGGGPLSGNEVLKGFSGQFTPNLTTKVLLNNGGPLQVLGFSPATIKHVDGAGADDYFDLDNRLTGIKPPAAFPVEVLSRPVMVPGATNSRLVSLLAPTSFAFVAKTAAQDVKCDLQFWFKDVLFEGNKAILDDKDASIAFDVWDQAKKLAGAGFEWRLVPSAETDAEAAFRLGRTQIPFFGFWLEPMRLTALSLANNTIASAAVLCRLTLGKAELFTDPSLNLVMLNLTLDTDGHTLRAAFEDTPLRFSFAVADALSNDRRVAIDAQIKSSDASPPVFDLNVSKFAVDVAGVDLEFKSATVAFALRTATGVIDVVSFTAENKNQVTTPGAGQLRIVKAKLTAGLKITTDPVLVEPFDTELDLNYVIEMVPLGDTASSPTGVFGFEVNNNKAGNGKIAIFGKEAAFPTTSANEGDTAIVLAVPETKIASICEASLGLVVRLRKAGAAVEGIAELAYGHCEADLALADASVELGHGITASGATLRFTLSNDGSATSPGWKGTATVSGRLTAENSINWPALDWKPSPPTIPLPREPKANNGRVTVTPQAVADASSHTVTWTLSDHRLDLALAAALARQDGAAVWSTFVTAQHTLSRGAKRLQWTGVETVAVGYPAAMIPKLPIKPDNTLDLGRDTTTFAARYKGRIRQSVYDMKVEPGMHTPGVGAVATVLQGALGAAFRTAFWKHQPATNGLIVMGGFLGALRLDAEEAAPLLRLPVLAGLGERKIGQAVPAGGIELAWADGPAARLLALTKPGSPSPADASLDALSAAIVAGSLPLPPSNVSDGWDDPVAALLVEQSYVNADLAGTAAMETTPFFLASAVMVERIFRLAHLQVSDRIESLSLLAGASPVRKQNKNPIPLSLAAAVAMGNRKPPSDAPSPPPPRFALVGDRLTVADWKGPPISDSDSTPIPTLNGLAVARDTNPRVAFVTGLPIASSKVAIYFPYAFPPAMFEALGATANAFGRFADHGRGPVSMPGAEQPLRWLAPVMEGAGKPIRDDDDAIHIGSGLSGLTRRIRLPAHAGTEIELASAETDEDLQTKDDFVWLSQSQVPIYLPVQTTGLKGPPIGWLTPSTPFVRLPASGDVLQTVRATGGDDSVPQDGESRKVQPFLPQEMSVASVGERAGVMTARRARLLGSLGAIGTFDPMYARFGRPAQGGSSFARQLRTPRPAKLPVNTGDAGSDRRIQASSVQAMTAFDAVIGSADIVEGEKIGDHDGAWSIRVIAAPEVESAASDLWDGTVRLACRICIVSDVAPLVKPHVLLGKALIGGPVNKLETRGLLKIGTSFIPFSRARFSTAADWVPHSKDPKTTQRGDVDIILIPQMPTQRDPFGYAHPDIAKAFSTPGPLPAVEVQWTIHPSSARHTTVVEDKTELSLTVVDPTTPELAQGDDRAPVTLRMPLYAVTAIRGALPLTPATLLFADPAYDRDLAGPPVSEGERLELTDEAKTLLPPGRGDLKLVLSADRGQLNRRGTITFMLDARFERPMDDIAQSVAENVGVGPGGDLMRAQDEVGATIRLELQPRGGSSRPLRFGKVQDSTKAKTAIKLGTVYELPLAALTEVDGAPAALSAGDVLVMEAALIDKDDTAVPPKKGTQANVWNSAAADKVTISLLPKLSKDPGRSPLPSRSLRFVLTDDPVIEPPPALYAALLRTAYGPSWRLSTPLHAQSPLPWRVDLVDPARDFRRGMMRRHASFVWTLIRPRADFAAPSVYVVKADRNGQTYLPEAENEFLTPEKAAPWKVG